MADLKKPLYYTLLGRWGSGTGYTVFAVTSETGFRKQRVNGRLIDHKGNYESTHARSDDCIGRFETEQAARDKIAAVVVCRQKHHPLIEAARSGLRAAEQAETAEIREILGT